MEKLPIPLFNKTYKNVDGIEINDENFSGINGFVNEKGAFNKRPGLQYFQDFLSSFTTPNITRIDGIYYFQDAGLVIVVVGGKVFKISKSGLVYTKTEITGTTGLQAGKQVYFAYDGTYLFMANGGQITYIDSTASSLSVIADADCPTAVTQIAWMDGYLFAITGANNRFYFSEVNDSLNWNALDFAAAVGSPDKIVGIRIVNREILLFGSRSLEIWNNDGVTPFIKTNGGDFNQGCIAPDSIIETTDGTFWINQDKHIVKFDGRTVSILNLDFDLEFSKIQNISDCVCDKLETLGRKFLLFGFAEEEKTLVYDVFLNQWTEWNCKIADNDFKRFIGSNIVFIPEWNLTLAGSVFNEVILKIDSRDIIYKDIFYTTEDSHKEIVLERITGHIDYGVPEKKISQKIVIRLKKGAVDIGREAKLLLYINDDNKGFGNAIEVSLGNVGEKEIVTEIPYTGHFFTRQYKIVVSDEVPVSLGSAFQFFEVTE